MSIGNKLFLPHSTISIIWKDREKIITAFDSNKTGAKKKRANRHSVMIQASGYWNGFKTREVKKFL